ncbi:MAG TPA: hypothetical protein VFD08_00615 [Clostridia bacterium]|nr:hypothetical protein [Clostridia bacterium]
MNSDKNWENKTYTLLGFAAKSGVLVSGTFAIKRALKEDSLGLLLFSEECSNKTIASFLYHSDIDHIILGPSERMSKTTGVKNRHVFAVKKGKLAENMIKEISRR